jgi:hypothetical protein
VDLAVKLYHTKNDGLANYWIIKWIKRLVDHRQEDKTCKDRSQMKSQSMPSVRYCWHEEDEELEKF